MKPIILLILSTLALAAGQQSSLNNWSACDTAGNNIPIQRASGDLITLPLPSPASKKLDHVAFLVSHDPALAGNLTGKTITAIFTLAITGTPNYTVGYTGGGSAPANMRLYFTTASGNYNINDADKNDTRYWWTDVDWVDMVDADNGLPTALSSAFTDPTAWSDANGHSAAESPAYTAAFNAAIGAVAQIGFSFGGGSFFDTGVGVDNNGTATLHVSSFTAQ